MKLRLGKALWLGEELVAIGCERKKKGKGCTSQDGYHLGEKGPKCFLDLKLGDIFTEFWLLFEGSI